MKFTTKIGTVGILIGLILVACATPIKQQTTTKSQAAQAMVVYKSPTCGCCGDWVRYAEEHGYTVTVKEMQDMTPVKAEHSIPPTMQSCHTTLIDGYVIEGHVPIEDVERLLTERPNVAGIAVPGMPVGSPGMEVAGTEPQPFDVMTFDTDGNTDVFSRHSQ
ncbi:MAG: DUF411 domain-containing protein [Chloroflexi bacterium AL-W]|nr:DUF411 domain-containing protein [Chloroflexi bacterium AL-N1]NOK70886.1 DUF411 domain-containing protein [Chloroflexi bacterium AL-N10]NOK78555.1 DUF411 domain-containing protein [Chloroflexi bacterium AL-N5]NOK85787.1 DUF411 domain-containing protein [Chloroflexi bacterium AL-W]NOK92703.1 DUF411 domain-containing protein [Chloroflexi bacterium AL-N15]